jgi:hypothetical protein
MGWYECEMSSTHGGGGVFIGGWGTKFEFLEFVLFFGPETAKNS